MSVSFGSCILSLEISAMDRSLVQMSATECASVSVSVVRGISNSVHRGTQTFSGQRTSSVIVGWFTGRT